MIAEDSQPIARPFDDFDRPLQKPASSAWMSSLEQRILVCAPTANDARLTAEFLTRAGIQPLGCMNIPELCLRMDEGCGGIILAEEVLVSEAVTCLNEALRRQPSWSDIPIIVVCSTTGSRAHINQSLQLIGAASTISLVERPFRPETLVSMIQASLRSRARQYQVRDLLTELATNEARMRRILEQSVVGLAEADLTGRFTLVNDRYCAMVARPREELLKLRLPDLTHPDDCAESKNRIVALASGRATSFIVEKRLLKPDGTVVWVHDHLSVIRDGEDRPCGITVASADITQRKEDEQQISRARDEALAASRAKDDFLASLSHELRTPLNPVLLLASEAARNVLLPSDVKADFDVIARNITLEARLIDDLLDLTRITRGKLQLTRQNHLLHTILEDAIATVQPDFAERRVTLRRSYATQSPTIFGDSVRLQQVFWNVLKNAAKFTPCGGAVTVETRYNPGETHAAVAITDTGIGMSEGEIERVFDAFVQGDHATRRTHHFGGLGLGLAISKMLVNLHEGKIAASSAGAGRGSTFTIELPVVAAAEVSKAPLVKAEAASSDEPSSIRRILLVDDHEATRNALSFLLQRRKFEVIPAGSLSEAFAAAEQGGIQLIVSDIGLPDGTGYELMERFAKPNGVKGIALTGYGMEQDVEQSERAGFAAHLTKPVRVEALDEALKTVMATG
jgi:PAS domain S-box-containing protein